MLRLRSTLDTRRVFDRLIAHVGGQDGGNVFGLNAPGDGCVEGEGDRDGGDKFDQGGERLVVFNGFQGELKKSTAIGEAVDFAPLKVVGTHLVQAVRFSFRTPLTLPASSCAPSFLEDAFADKTDGQHAACDREQGNE